MGSPPLRNNLLHPHLLKPRRQSKMQNQRQPADAMITAWAHGDFNGPARTDAENRLRVNMAASEAIGLRGTPTVIWRKADGSQGRIDGLPEDWNAVIASMGGERHAE
jgi:thiol:disulfide interchange protein DsbG